MGRVKDAAPRRTPILTGQSDEEAIAHRACRMPWWKQLRVGQRWICPHGYGWKLLERGFGRRTFVIYEPGEQELRRP